MSTVVPSEIANDKREISILPDNLLIFNAKPEAIVRPLRRREPSDDDNRSPDLEDLEAQIIDKLNKLEKPHKLHKQISKDSDRKFLKEIKRNTAEVSLNHHFTVNL
jgi:hypothetical protein